MIYRPENSCLYQYAHTKGRRRYEARFYLKTEMCVIPDDNENNSRTYVRLFKLKYVLRLVALREIK